MEQTQDWVQSIDLFLEINFAFTQLRRALEPRHFHAQPALTGLAPPSRDAQTAVWSQPLEISADGNSWFPDITADVTGRVHVIWSSNELMYRSWYAGTWTPSNDIVVAVDAAGNQIFDPFRTAIAADHTGLLHLFYYHLTEGLGYYTHAPLNRAGIPNAWAPRQVIGAQGNGYYSMLVVDSRNRLHAVYIDTSSGSQVADIFYRRSEDGGQTGTLPYNLSNTPLVGSNCPQIIIDRNDVIHVSWDEGWDRRGGARRVYSRADHSTME